MFFIFQRTKTHIAIVLFHFVVNTVMYMLEKILVHVINYGNDVLMPCFVFHNVS